MIVLSEATRVYRQMPKTACCRNLMLPKSVKNKFVSDVDKLVLEYALTPESLHLSENSDEELLVLQIETKAVGYDTRILEAIAKQNAHHVLFMMCFERMEQFAVVYKNELYRTECEAEGGMTLYPAGSTIREIWEKLIADIALADERISGDGRSLDERLARQERAVRLETAIQKEETAARREKQPRRKHELYEKLKKHEQELEELRSGQA